MILDAAETALTGRRPVVPPTRLGDRHIPVPMPTNDLTPDGPAYEVMYLLDAEDARIPDLKKALAPLGDSLVVVGGGGLWNVHVHVDDVGAALEAGIVAGRPYRVRVTHFAEQIVAARSRTSTRSGRRIVAVAAGDGLRELFEQAGAVVVPGGPGRRPSTGMLVDAIEEQRRRRGRRAPQRPRLGPGRRDRRPHRRGVGADPRRGHPERRAGPGPGRDRRARARPVLRPGRPAHDRDRPARPPRRGHRRRPPGDHDGRALRARRRPRRHRGRLRRRRRRPLRGGRRHHRPARRWRWRAGHARRRPGRAATSPNGAGTTSSRPTRPWMPWCTTEARSATRCWWPSSSRSSIDRDHPRVARRRRARQPVDQGQEEGRGPGQGPRRDDRRRAAAALPAHLPQDRRAHRGRRPAGGPAAHRRRRGADQQGRLRPPGAPRRGGPQDRRPAAAADRLRPAAPDRRVAAAAAHARRHRRLHRQGRPVPRRLAAHQPADGDLRRGRRPQDRVRPRDGRHPQGAVPDLPGHRHRRDLGHPARGQLRAHRRRRDPRAAARGPPHDVRRARRRDRAPVDPRARRLGPGRCRPQAVPLRGGADHPARARTAPGSGPRPGRPGARRGRRPAGRLRPAAAVRADRRASATSAYSSRATSPSRTR